MYIARYTFIENDSMRVTFFFFCILKTFLEQMLYGFQWHSQIINLRITFHNRKIKSYYVTNV